MHNNSDASGGECYLPHVVESVLFTEDCDVLFSPAWKLNTQENVRVKNFWRWSAVIWLDVTAFFIPQWSSSGLTDCILLILQQRCVLGCHRWNKDLTWWKNFWRWSAVIWLDVTAFLIPQWSSSGLTDCILLIFSVEFSAELWGWTRIIPPDRISGDGGQSPGWMLLLSSSSRPAAGGSHSKSSFKVWTLNKKTHTELSFYCHEVLSHAGHGTSKGCIIGNRHTHTYFR